MCRLIRGPTLNGLPRQESRTPNHKQKRKDMHMKTTKMTRPNPSVLRVLVKKQLSTRKTLRTYLTRAAAGAKVTLIVTKFRSIYGPHGRGCKRAGVPMTSHLISRSEEHTSELQSLRHL